MGKILSDFNFVNSLPKANIVLHFAGQSSGEKSMEDPIRDLQDNYVSTINLVEYANKHLVDQFFFSSSMSVYGSGNLLPLTNYGVHKLSSEFFLKNNIKVSKVTIFRFFNVYGPGQDLKDLKQGMVSIFLAQTLSSDTVYVKGSLDRIRNFVYIDDLVYFFAKVLNNEYVFNDFYSVHDIASSEATSVGDLIKNIFSLWGERKVVILPGTPGDQFLSVSNNSILNIVLGKESVKINEGLEKWKQTIN